MLDCLEMNSDFLILKLRRNRRVLTLTTAVILSVWCISLTFVVRERMLTAATIEQVEAVNQATIPLLYVLLFFMSILLGGYIGYFNWHRRKELLLQAERERVALMNMLTHQLASPVSILKWWSEIAEEEIGKDHAQLFKELQEPVETLDVLIADLREAQDVQAGTVKYTPKHASLRSVVEYIITDYAPRFERKNIQIEVECEDALEVQMDESLVSGIIRELLDNAIDYSPENSTVFIHAFRKKRHVIVSVRDEGCGIPKEDLKHVFEKFTRGHDAQKHKPISTGLGLYIVKGIVEQMGGDIQIHSEVGKGTDVSFALPVR